MPADRVYCCERDGGMLGKHLDLINKSGGKPFDGVRFDVSRARLECTHKRKLIEAVQHPLRQERFAFHNCAPNELDSLLRRHVIPQEEPSQEFIDFAENELKQMYYGLGAPILEPMNAEELLKTRSAHVRKRWAKVASQAESQEFRKSEALVKTFIKYEKYGMDHLAINKPPRAIQARGPLYTYRLAQYLVPIEHRMWNWKPKSNFGLRVFAKGRNAQQRANDLAKMELWSDTVFICVDHSKFDSRVHAKHLKISHGFNSRFFRGSRRSYLKRLMRCQLANKCITSNGIFYSVEGRRMSGDIDTAKGNCEINYTVLRYILRNIPSAIYLDGDDSVIAVPAAFADEVVRRVQTTKDTGMQSTVEVVKDLHHVEFCQSKPIRSNGKLMMMRNPIKAVSNMCFLMDEPPEGIATRLASVGTGEMHSSTGCPVIYPFAKALSALGTVNPEYYEYRHKLNLSLPPKEPDDQARADAWFAWDLDLLDQQRSSVSCRNDVVRAVG